MKLKLLTTEQVSEILQVPVGTLVWWRAVGKGPDTVKVGGGIRYDEDALIQFVNAGRRVNSVQASKGTKHGALQAKA